ncbi:MAG TPA: acyltransferase family protein [Candidatus Dormibacteraeota bacterium]
MAAPRTRASIQLRHSPGLDGLRALAVAAVVLFHAGATWLGGGFLGVDVFFVLSGFLITSLLLAEWRRRRKPRIDFVAFWRRRARRILPALYLCLAAVLLAWLIARPAQVAAVRLDALAAFGYAANWWFLFGSQPYFETAGHPSPFLHLWSLGVEEQFYLLWPLLFFLVARLRRLAPVLLVLGAVAGSAAGAFLYRGGADPSAVYYNTGTHSAGLLLGSALAFVWRPGARLRRGRGLRRALTSRPFAQALTASSLAGLLAAFALINQASGHLYEGGLGIVAVLTAALIVGVTHPAGSTLTRVLDTGPLRWLGTRSYSLYLWHWPALVLVGFSPVWAPVAVAAAVLCAEVSYCFVEMPIRRNGLRGLLGADRPAPAATRRRLVPAGGLAAAATAALVLVVAMAPTPARPAYLARIAVNTVGSVQAAGLTAVRPDLATRWPTPPPSPVPSPSPTLPTLPIVAVGDSVMVGAAPAMAHAIPGIEIDAREGRQVQTGLQVLEGLQPSGRLDGAVVVDLGNNGTFTSDQLSAFMKTLSSARLVVFVNLKEDEPWTAANNQLIDAAPQQYPNAVLVNWAAASSSHPEYFWDDGLHLRPEGAQVYAQLIWTALTSHL